MPILSIIEINALLALSLQDISRDYASPVKGLLSYIYYRLKVQSLYPLAPLIASGTARLGVGRRRRDISYNYIKGIY